MDFVEVYVIVKVKVIDSEIDKELIPIRESVDESSNKDLLKVSSHFLVDNRMNLREVIVYDDINVVFDYINGNVKNNKKNIKSKKRKIYRLYVIRDDIRGKEKKGKKVC